MWLHCLAIAIPLFLIKPYQSLGQDPTWSKSFPACSLPAPSLHTVRNCLLFNPSHPPIFPISFLLILLHNETLGHSDTCTKVEDWASTSAPVLLQRSAAVLGNQKNRDGEYRWVRGLKVSCNFKCGLQNPKFWSQDSGIAATTGHKHHLLNITHTLNGC